MKTSSSATHLIAIAAIAGAVATGFISGPAFAQDPAIKKGPFKFEFAYDPVELASAKSAESLLLRLQEQVRIHCGGHKKLKPSERALVASCTNITMTESIGKFRSPALAQAYEGRIGG